MLPIQLIPYFQYTVAAVIGTLILGLGCWQKGQKGFLGAVVAVDTVDPDSLLTPWLIFCWLKLVVQGFRRAHAVLGRFYDLSGVRTGKRVAAWEEVAGYFSVFAWKPDTPAEPQLSELLQRYSQVTAQFLFGNTSQQRLSSPP